VVGKILIFEVLELFLVDFSEARDLFVNIFGLRGLTEKSGTAG
jgi:hypothetical protein